jgi:transcriptional regulator of NAD metabolism
VNDFEFLKKQWAPNNKSNVSEDVIINSLAILQGVKITLPWRREYWVLTFSFRVLIDSRLTHHVSYEKQHSSARSITTVPTKIV